MNIGTYEEPLPCGGKLKITKKSWEIFYYFSGPDLRYNGDIISIQGSFVEKYISAFIDNWSEYESLKMAIPTGGDFSKQAKMDMTIRIGNFAEGVCIKSYHMPISSKRELDKLIDGYRYASKRAPQIQAFLASL